MIASSSAFVITVMNKEVITVCYCMENKEDLIWNFLSQSKRWMVLQVLVMKIALRLASHVIVVIHNCNH